MAIDKWKDMDSHQGAYKWNKDESTEYDLKYWKAGRLKNKDNKKVNKCSRKLSFLTLFKRSRHTKDKLGQVMSGILSINHTYISLIPFPPLFILEARPDNLFTNQTKKQNKQTQTRSFFLAQKVITLHAFVQQTWNSLTQRELH